MIGCEQVAFSLPPFPIDLMTFEEMEGISLNLPNPSLLDEFRLEITPLHGYYANKRYFHDSIWLKVDLYFKSMFQIRFHSTPTKSSYFQM